MIRILLSLPILIGTYATLALVTVLWVCLRAIPMAAVLVTYDVKGKEVACATMVLLAVTLAACDFYDLMQIKRLAHQRDRDAEDNC